LTESREGWLGRQFDSETGNNYLINRYYNADRGSFLSPDRYQYVLTTTPFTFNLYQYGYANPLVNTDPEGNAPPLQAWARGQQLKEQAKREDRAAFEKMLKRIGMTEGMFNESEERGFHHVGNGIFRHKQMFDLDILFGTGLFAPEHEVITEWKWEEDGKKLTLQRAWPTSENPKGVEAETAIFNVLMGAKAIQFGYEAMGIRGALMQFIDDRIGLPVTTGLHGATRLGRRAFRKLVSNESGFVRMAGESADDVARLGRKISKKRIPRGVDFEGTIWRYEYPERISSTWEAGPWNVAANHRYSRSGVGAVYGGLTKATARKEMEYYGVLAEKVATRKKVSLDNFLDLRDKDMRAYFGVSIGDIVGDSYEHTQRIGDWALANGYRGIIAPSARFAGRANLVVFGGF